MDISLFEKRILFEALKQILENQRIILDSLHAVIYSEQEKKTAYLSTQCEGIINHSLQEETLLRGEINET